MKHTSAGQIIAGAPEAIQEVVVTGTRLVKDYADLVAGDRDAAIESMRQHRVDNLHLLMTILQFWRGQGVMPRRARNVETPKIGSALSKYENPGHHDPSGGGPNPYNSLKSVLPGNHEELWDKSAFVASNGNRCAKEGSGNKAVYHRFQNDRNGNWHWNGSTNGQTAGGVDRAIGINQVPIEVKRW